MIPRAALPTFASSSWTAATLILVGLLLGGTSLSAQAWRPGPGAVDTGLLLRQMDGVKRVLMIAAHPDDEDTALLAAAARGMGAQVAYLSLSRGEGGQNLIGPELGEGMGIIRTGELLAARRLDGAQQYFTRAFDFGFSKRADEALEHWPMEVLLEDVVWLVRKLRPQVVVSIFSGTSRDGHGQHQAAGLVAAEAFSAAADSTRFPHQLRMGVEVWQPSKFYTSHRFSPDLASLMVPTGIFDPLLGRSWFQVAMESRSQHRSQDMGASQPLGPRASPLRLEARIPPLPTADDTHLFAGVDTTFLSLVPDSDGESQVRRLWEHVAAYGDAVQAAAGNLHAFEPWRASSQLARALHELRLAEGLLGFDGAYTPELRDEVSRRLELGQKALLSSAGVVLDVRASRELLVPGEELEVVVQLWNGGPFPVRNVRPALFLPPGWVQSEDPAPVQVVPAGGAVEWTFSVRVPSGTTHSQPYFLEEERDGSLYRWPPDPDLLGLPGNPPLISGGVELTLEVRLPGQTTANAPWDRPTLQGVKRALFVGLDKADGEFRRPLAVVPALDLATEPSIMAWPLGLEETRVVTVRLRNHGVSTLRGVVSLEAPTGWLVEPMDQELEIPPGEGEQSYEFTVQPGAAVPEGMHRLQAVARTQGGRVFREGFTLIDYPHIDPVPLFHTAQTQISVFPVAVADRRVGYIMGSGDDGARALRQMGMDVEVISPERLQAGDFSDFDVLVLGIRTYEVRPEVGAVNAAILEFARRGGTVVSQYNKYEYPEGGFAPYRVAMRRPHHRVTDPQAQVTFLEPDHPVLNWPNRLGPDDFSDWVQERGLYFLSEWEAPFRPLLSMADPEEDPSLGSLVVAPVGDGFYIYTGLAFFRQLPEGVPGAHRLLANLVAAQAPVAAGDMDGVDADAAADRGR
ncbi:MAG: NEW3 domain-containing protein [Gemmatimonadota bacterium]